METSSILICQETINDIINEVGKIASLIDRIKTINIDKLSKLMYEISKMPTDNMSRFIVSELLENVFASLINGKYVGDNSVWDTDIIYPSVEFLRDDHLKLEVKSLKVMFLKSGDTKPLTIKNGRGEGQTIKSLIPTIKKNLFILIEKDSPFSISYVYPHDLMLYVGNKSTAKKILDIENDNELLNKTTAELYGYVKKNNIHFIHKGILKDNFEAPELYNPKKEMIDTYVKRFID